MKVGRIKREQALKKVVISRVENDRTRCIVKYDPRLPRFSETLRSCWKILIEDPVMKKIYPSPPMACFTREWRIWRISWLSLNFQVDRDSQEKEEIRQIKINMYCNCKMQFQKDRSKCACARFLLKETTFSRLHMLYTVKWTWNCIRSRLHKKSLKILRPGASSQVHYVLNIENI